MDVTTRFIFEDQGLDEHISKLDRAEKEYEDLRKANDAAFKSGTEQIAKQVNSVAKLEQESKKLNETTKQGNSQVVEAIKNYRIFGVSINDVQERMARANAVLKSYTAGTRAAGAGNTFLSRTLRVLRVALLSTGIGAIVVALGSLVTFLTTTQRGMDALTAVTRPLTTIMQRLLGVVQDLGGDVFDGLTKAVNDPIQAFKDLGQAIVDNLINRARSIGVFSEAIQNLFAGNFRQAATGFFDATNQLVLGIENSSERLAGFAKETSEFFKESVEQGTQLDRLQKSIERAEINIIKRRAELNRITKEQNLLANDQTRSLEEREASARAGAQAQNDLLALETDFINRKIALIKLEQSFNDTSRADLKELAMLEAQRDGNAQRAAQQLLRLNGTLNTIRNQAAAQLKAQNDELEKQLAIITEQAAAVDLDRSSELERIIAARRTAVEQLQQVATEVRNIASQIGREIDIDEDVNKVLDAIQREFNQGVDDLKLRNPLETFDLSDVDVRDSLNIPEDDIQAELALNARVRLRLNQDPTLFESIENFKNSVLSRLGINEAEAKALVSTISDVFSSFQMLAAANLQIQIADQDALIERLEEGIEKRRSILDEQLDAQKRGAANSFAAEKQNLARQEALLREAEEERDRLRRKALNAQLVADGLAQTSALATAAAQLIAANASIPVVGLVIAGGLLATMLSLFATFKQNAASATQLREGINPIADKSIHSKGKGFTISSGKHGSGKDAMFVQREKIYFAEDNEILMGTRASEANPQFYKNANTLGLDEAIRRHIGEAADTSRNSIVMNSIYAGLTRKDLDESNKPMIEAIKSKGNLVGMPDGSVVEILYNSKGDYIGRRSVGTN